MMEVFTNPTIVIISQYASASNIKLYILSVFMFASSSCQKK